MKVQFYDKKDEDNDALVSELKRFDDEVFGFGPNIVNITEAEIKEVLAHGFILALRQNDELAAFIQFQKKGALWYCGGICTHKNYQGKGLGDTLLSEAKKIVKGKHITATVRENNLPSLHLFIRKNGFIATKYLKNHFGIGNDRLLIEFGPKIESLRKRLTTEKLELVCNTKKEIETAFGSGFVVAAIRGENLVFFRKKHKQ